MPVARTTYNSLVDDSGGGTDGTIVTKAIIDGLLDDVDTGIAGLTSNGTNVTQIAFPATQSASSNANTFDDYEEGTWTPADASGAGLSLTIGTSQFIKKGQEVTAWFNITYPSTADTSNSEISGLPYTSQNVQALGGPMTLTSYSTAPVSAHVNNSATTFRFYNNSAARLTNANLSGRIMEGFVIYRASA